LKYIYQGDVRVNQHPNIAVATISLLRAHNLLCDDLKKINPEWDDERLYQEARRLLIAMYQHVVYYEFVPALIGTYIINHNIILPIIVTNTKKKLKIYLIPILDVSS